MTAGWTGLSAAIQGVRDEEQCCRQSAAQERAEQMPVDPARSDEFAAAQLAQGLLGGGLRRQPSPQQARTGGICQAASLSILTSKRPKTVRP